MTKQGKILLVNGLVIFLCLTGTIMHVIYVGFIAYDLFTLPIPHWLIAGVLSLVFAFSTVNMAREVWLMVTTEARLSALAEEEGIVISKIAKKRAVVRPFHGAANAILSCQIYYFGSQILLDELTPHPLAIFLIALFISFCFMIRAISQYHGALFGIYIDLQFHGIYYHTK